MCNYGSSSVKPSSQKSYATYSQSYQETILESKSTKDLSRGSDCHKGAPTSMLMKHSRRVSLPGNQVSSVNTITVTLIPLSTKELHQERWGSPHPPHKVVDAASHQVGGSLTLPASLKAPRCRRTKKSCWFTKEPQHKGTKPCSLTL